MRILIRLIQIFFNAVDGLIEGLRTFTLHPNGRRTPLYGGGFEQDRANLRGDVRNVAGDMRRATDKVKARMEERQGI